MQKKLVGIIFLSTVLVGCSGSSGWNGDPGAFPPMPLPTPVANLQLTQGTVKGLIRAGSSAVIFPNLSISGDLQGATQVTITVDDNATLDNISTLPAGVTATLSNASKTLVLTFDNSFSSAAIADFIKNNVKASVIAANISKKFVAKIAVLNNGVTVDNGAGASFIVAGIGALNLLVDDSGFIIDLDTNQQVTGFIGIQGAINKVASVSSDPAADGVGSIINVAPGDYVALPGDYQITPDADLAYLSILGPNFDKSANATVLAPGSSGNRGSEATIHPNNGLSWIVGNIGITISGLKISNSAITASPLLTLASGGCTVSNNIFENTQNIILMPGIINNANSGPKNIIQGNSFSGLFAGVYQVNTQPAVISYNCFYSASLSNFDIYFSNTADWTSDPMDISHNVFDSSSSFSLGFNTIDPNTRINLNNNDFLKNIRLFSNNDNSSLAAAIFNSSGNYLKFALSSSNFLNPGYWPANPETSLFSGGNNGFNTTKNFPNYQHP